MVHHTPHGAATERHRAPRHITEVEPRSEEADGDAAGDEASHAAASQEWQSGSRICVRLTVNLPAHTSSR